MIHKTTEERYQKLRKIFTRLKDHFNRDDLDEFVQTANSLQDWIRGDNTLMPEQKAAFERFAVPEGVDRHLCKQIANQQKHKHARPRTKKAQAKFVPDVNSVDTKPGGAGIVVPSSMRVVFAEEEIVIKFGDVQESAIGFVIRTFRQFHYIFEVIPIQTGEGVSSRLAGILD